MNETSSETLSVVIEREPQYYQSAKGAGGWPWPMHVAGLQRSALIRRFN
jgi:hypothetical protein